jgi:KipI family sensor histidine kinase inhibitor
MPNTGITGARLLRCGERGVLVEVKDLDTVLSLNELVTGLVNQGHGAWHRVLDVVPAARTLLVTTSSESALATLRVDLAALLRAQAIQGGLAIREGRGPGSVTIEIPVHYDGPDLEDVSELTGLTVGEVIAAHTGRPWRVAFGGFAPGFAYLAEGDPRLNVPRRSTPRTVVPAGAVGLAGPFSGIYPRPSPGGWQLLGHTDLALWETERQPPALLQPGYYVRFVVAGDE